MVEVVYFYYISTPGTIAGLSGIKRKNLQVVKKEKSLQIIKRKINRIFTQKSINWKILQTAFKK